MFSCIDHLENMFEITKSQPLKNKKYLENFTEIYDDIIADNHTNLKNPSNVPINITNYNYNTVNDTILPQVLQINGEQCNDSEDENKSVELLESNEENSYNEVSDNSENLESEQINVESYLINNNGRTFDLADNKICTPQRDPEWFSCNINECVKISTKTKYNYGWDETFELMKPIKVGTYLTNYTNVYNDKTSDVISFTEEITPQWDTAPTSDILQDTKPLLIDEYDEEISAMTDQEIKECLALRINDDNEIAKILMEQKVTKNENPEKILPIANQILKTNYTERLIEDLSMGVFNKNNLKIEYIDFSAADNDNNALIHWACIQKNEYLLELCINNNADLNLRGQNGCVPLICLFIEHVGCQPNKKQFYFMTKLLLDKQIDINTLNNEFDLLKIACKNYLHVAPFELLINAGITINNNFNQYSALDYSFMCPLPYYKVFELLLFNGDKFVHEDEKYDKIKNKFLNRFRKNFSILLQSFLYTITEKWIHNIISGYFI